MHLLGRLILRQAKRPKEGRFDSFLHIKPGHIRLYVIGRKGDKMAMAPRGVDLRNWSVGDRSGCGSTRDERTFKLEPYSSVL
jgi:hypothetical protein